MDGIFDLDLSDIYGRALDELSSMGIDVVVDHESGEYKIVFHNAREKGQDQPTKRQVELNQEVAKWCKIMELEGYQVDMILCWLREQRSICASEHERDSNDAPDQISNDPVKAPGHYAGDGKISCMDAIKSMLYGSELPPTTTYWWASALKYLWRWPWKNKRQDLEKAMCCIEYTMKELEDE